MHGITSSALGDPKTREEANRAKHAALTFQKSVRLSLTIGLNSAFRTPYLLPGNLHLPGQHPGSPL